MQKNAPLTLLCIIYSLIVTAQPQPCVPPPGMTSFCEEACIICDINGFTGINDDTEKGQAPPGFCTNNVHHMQWIGFIAGSVNLTLHVKVFDCKSAAGNGLEVGIYKSLDCENFELVSNCDGDIREGETGVFYNIKPLTIGQYYFFVMDGNNNDVCRYTITVVEGTTNVSKLPFSGPLSGEEKVCPETTALYTLDPPTGATWFSWTLDGVPVKSGIDSTLQMKWDILGEHQLCVTASNVCDTAPQTCKTVLIRPTPVTNIVTSICDTECWTGADTTLCDAGFYSFTLNTWDHCDSIVNLQLKVIPSTTSYLDLLICSGDTVTLGDKPFFKTGTFSETLTNAQGCDSIATLDLQVIICEIKGELDPEPVKCTGTNTGALHFKIKDGTPPFQYQWERVGPGAPSGSGNVNALNNEIEVPGLPKGLYFITVTDNFGNDLVLFDDVTEPTALLATLSTTDHLGFEVSCAGGADGTIDLEAQGGTPPYTYAWSNQQSTPEINQLPAGIYTCTITDARGCTEIYSQNLEEAPPLVIRAEFTDPGCEGYSSGKASVISSAGGVPPYEYALSGGAFSKQTQFSDLFYGLQKITLRDANGCLTDTSVVLDKPLLPTLQLVDEVTVDLGEKAPLELYSSVPLDSIVWTPPYNLTCLNCPEPEAFPYRTTTYFVQVFSLEDGCPASDSVRIVIRDKRDVYVPNIFSPYDDDGKNDFFTVYGGPEVAQISFLRVWSRWGELVFEREQFEPNKDKMGWDGEFRGKTVMPGVYAWQAEILFVDGVKSSLEGSITVLR